MSQVQVDQKNYRMPPQDGITIAHFLTVADVERSLRFTKRSSEVAFSAGATAKARRGTSRSRTHGSSSTPGAVRHLINRR